jgi:hypothetical protein
MHLIASNDKATVVGTGKSSRTNLCKHLARPPCVGVAIGAVGVISEYFDVSCCNAAFLCVVAA